MRLLSSAFALNVFLATFVLAISVALSPTAAQSSKNWKQCKDWRGKKYSIEQRIAGCTAVLKSRRQSRRNHAIALNNRGLAYYQQKDYDRAIADYTEAIRLNPRRIWAFRHRGLAYYKNKDYDRAIADYAEAIRLDPKYAWAYNSRGLAYSGKKDYDRAIADYTEAIRLDPKYASAYNSRGKAYYQKKNYDRAVVDFTKAIRFNDRERIYFTNRAHLHYLNKNFDLALADYGEAIHLDPKFAAVHFSRGLVYQEIGEWILAIADYTRTIKIDPEYKNVYSRRGYAYAKIGNYDRAIQDYDKAIVLSYQKLEGLLPERSIWESQQLADQASNMVDQLKQITSDDAVREKNARVRKSVAQIWQGRGNTYYKKGDFDRAIVDYNESIKIGDGRHNSVSLDRGLAHKAKGDKQRAFEDYADGMLSSDFISGLLPKNGIAYRDIFRGFDSVVRQKSGKAGAAIVKVTARMKSLGRPTKGLGFVLDKSGLIVVDGKVVENMNEISVGLEDGTTLRAEVLGLDAESLIAILKVKPEKPLPALEIDNSENIRSGDWAVFVGFQSSITLSGGIVLISAFDRYRLKAPYEGFILIDVNDLSFRGSPLLNFEGKVIGMNVTTSRESPYGYAVPARRLTDLLSDVRKNDRESVGR